AGLAAAAAPLLLRATGRLRLCAAFLCAEVFALLAYSAYRVAGWQNGTLWWIPCIPMLATLLMGIPAGVAAAGASFVVYAAFHLLFDAGFQPAGTMTLHDLSLIHMLAMCGITIVTLSFAAAFEAGKKGAIGRLTGEIADRRGVEEALRRSEARLANAQRIARIGGWEWDLRGGEIAVTGDARAIFALGEGATLTQERFLALIHPEDLPRVLAEIERSVREASRMSLDHRLLLPGGVEKIVHLEAENEFDASGEPARRVGFVQDVTERRRADAALRETEEKLRQSQKMEAIGRLAGGIAHDFNNLLSVIQGYAEVSAERPDVDPSLAADLREIVVAARRAAALTGGLLAFSRKQTVQPTTLS
ncbi:MAG: PAS domain-containing protein, partial [Candidatus Methylomirabilis sp.]|nr:PAS domain-containing protein [Deltaproteobacteria bacterium]